MSGLYATFEQWRQAWRAELLGKRIEIPCSSCDGDGVKECSECNHESDCSACEGEGREVIQSFNDHSPSGFLNISAYVSEIWRDFQQVTPGKYHLLPKDFWDAINKTSNALAIRYRRYKAQNRLNTFKMYESKPSFREMDIRIVTESEIDL